MKKSKAPLAVDARVHACRAPLQHTYPQMEPPVEPEVPHAA